MLRPWASSGRTSRSSRRCAAQIADGTLGVGDRLPAERELAARLRRLAHVGARGDPRAGGDGHRLRAPRRRARRRRCGASRATRSARSSACWSASTTSPCTTSIEFRVIVETGAARALAANGGGDALGPLLDRMEDPALPQAEFHVLDAAFHVALVRAAGNALLNLVEDAVDGLLRKLVLDVATSTGTGPTCARGWSASTARSRRRSRRGTRTAPRCSSRSTSASGAAGPAATPPSS